MNVERHYCIPLPPICPAAAVKSPIKAFKVGAVVQCGGALEAKFRCAKVVAQNFLLSVCKYVLTHVLNYLCIHMYVLMYNDIQSTKNINTTRHLKRIWKNKFYLRLKIVEN